MGSAFHILCPIYSGLLTLNVFMATRPWETITFSPYNLNRISLRLLSVFDVSHILHIPSYEVAWLHNRAELNDL